MPRSVSPSIDGLDEITVAENQLEYKTLIASPVEFQGGGRGLVSRWRFSDEERALIAAGEDLYFLQMTGGRPMQPVEFNVGRPAWAQ